MTAAVAVAAMTADLGAKAAALSWLAVPVDLRVLHLRVIRNPGIAFGLGSSIPAPILLSVLAAVCAVVLFAAWRGRLGGPVGAGLVVGGALANLIDRTLGGTVIDIFDLGWWPAFNLADCFIVLGAASLVVRPQRAAAS